MGDRSHMVVYCRKQDVKRFEKMGFGWSSEDETPKGIIAEMEDEANYGHDGEMPKDIPYFGWYAAGMNFDAHQLACDGKVYAEALCMNDGTLVVRLDEDGSTNALDMKAAEHYREVLARAKETLGS